jgi:alpha-galactosidase
MMKSEKTYIKRAGYHLTVLHCGIIILFGLIVNSGYSQKKDNLLPSMGWEPWNINHCDTSKIKWNEVYYKKLIDFMASSGLSDLGYKYLVIECDDHYRDDKGSWQVNKEKFPNGYESITNYAHQKGLKIKAYTDAGKGRCCCFNEGSYGHYEDDAKSWAKFNFDGVKIDWCGGDAEKLDVKTQYIDFFQAMIKYIHKPFDVEICSWGKGQPWLWGRFAGTMWRTSFDIDLVYDTSDVRLGGKWKALLRNIDENQHPDTSYVGPSKGYNYADMLLVGLPGGLNETEERTQFSLWAMMASPLYLGLDIFLMPQYAKDIVMNKEVIAIDQDPLGLQGKIIKEFKEQQIQVWSKLLKDGSKAIALFNRGETKQTISISKSDLGLSGNCFIRDLWKHEDLGKFNNLYTVWINPHETVLLKVAKKI